ncbi:MAG: heme exporter protein C [Bacteroidia bacterium]|jgi:heme exporter protein C
MFKSTSAWWKIAGVILVVYSLFMGLATKVGPGLALVTPYETSAEHIDVTVTGYNTHFNKASTLPKVWLKVDDVRQAAIQVKVLSDNELSVQFSPIHLPADTSFKALANLYIEDDYHGLFLGVDALKLTFKGRDSSEATSSCASKPQNLKTTFFSIPYRYLLYEGIRNLNFHVPMWFTMIALLFASVVFSIKYLNSGKGRHDVFANAFASVALLFGFMGILTGTVWAKYTWGVFWTDDPKLNGAAIGILIYVAYLILRSSIEEESIRSRISAVYNVIAFPIFITLIIILPKMAESLHPGSGGSVGFNTYDLNSNMRLIFYPAVMGWILIGCWLATLTGRVDVLHRKKLWNDLND